MGPVRGPHERTERLGASLKESARRRLGYGGDMAEDERRTSRPHSSLMHIHILTAPRWGSIGFLSFLTGLTHLRPTAGKH